jgi:preprotein translocase subunit SecD
LRQNLFAWLAGILVLTLLATYVVFAETIPVLNRDVKPKFGLDIVGGLQLVLQAQPRGDQPAITGDQLQAARNIIEDRANGTGAAEPVVQTAGQDRILVELPGITDLETATKIIQETAFLEFIDGEASQGATCTGCQVGDLVNTSPGGPRPEQLRLGGSTGTTTTVTSTQTLTGTTAQTTPVATATPPTKTFKTVVTGEEIDGSKVQVAFDQAGIPRVTFSLKGNGPGKLCTFTSANLGRYMPIVLDKKVISNPTIQGAICGGNGEITGLTLTEARKLSVQLRYGALPVSLTLLESRKISATLGQEAVDKSLVAGLIGLGLVVLFMLVYYRLPGALADVALVIYSLVSFAIFKFIPITLTLAGIAGFILSIGMAVDANVLIFARLKEEIRSGKTLPAAVEAGFDHAWPSIRDSNASTLMTCLILFWFGSTFGGASIIKGFALTLAIGVGVSLLTAITISRTFLRVAVRSALANSRWAWDVQEHRQAGTPVTEA